MKTDQIQLRRILLVIETGRCYEYKGEYYESLGSLDVKLSNGNWISHERYRKIGIDNQEYARHSLAFEFKFNKVTDPQKVMQEFGAIYQPEISTSKAEKSGK